MTFDLDSIKFGFVGTAFEENFDRTRFNLRKYCSSFSGPRKEDLDIVPLELRFELPTSSETPVALNLGPVVTRSLRGLSGMTFQVILNSVLVDYFTNIY